MNFLNSLMAPLGKEHCMVFYLFASFSLFLAVLALVRGFAFFTNKKTSNLGMILMFNSITLFLGYYIYRVLYSMCSRSLM
jgi:hypothetical protein